MGKIENAHRIRPMQIHKALDPLGSVLHRTHLFGETYSPALGFHGRQSTKGLGVGQTGKIREGDGLDVLLWSRLSGALFALDVSHDHRFGFCPDSPHQRHHRSIVTSDHLALWFFGGPRVGLARRGSTLLALLFLLFHQLVGLLVLYRLIRRSCFFCLSADCGFTHLHPHQLCQ